MATLTNTKIKDTYDGLLKTTNNDILPVSGVASIEDGLGNTSAISIGRANNGVTITGALTASGLAYPTSDGTAGQALATDGAGNLSFIDVTVDTPTLQEVTTAGATTTDTISVGGLTSTADATLNTIEVGIGTGAVSSNLVIGSSSFSVNTSGAFNAVIGNSSMIANTTGSRNTAVGNGVLEDNTTGGWNVGVGNGSLGDVTTGNYNVGVGVNALDRVTINSNNTALGYEAISLIDGADNTAIGYQAGRLALLNVPKTGGSQNVYIGSAIRSGAASTDNEIVIGYGVDGNGSNTATYGNASITDHYFTGDVNVTGSVVGNLSGTVLTASQPNITSLGTLTSLSVSGTILDSSGDAGTSGQILSSTGTGTNWIAAPSGNVTGSGTTDRVAKFTSSTAIGDSSIEDLASAKTITIASDGLVQLKSTLNYNGICSTVDTERLYIGGGSTGTDANGANIAYYGNSYGGSFSGALVLETGNTGSAFMQFDTNGSERMRIDSSGNVGIGLTPSMRFQVKSSGNTAEDVASFGNNNISDGLVVTTNGNLDWGFNARNSRNLTFSTNQSERMRISSTGNVGIGESSPATSLHISQADPVIRLEDTSVAGLYSEIAGSAGNVFISADESNNTGFSSIRFRVDATERMRITSGGEVYIAGTTDRGAYNLQCNGTGVWGQGAYVNGSDFRFKEDINPIKSGLDVVEKLKPVSYKYKEEFSRDTTTQAGFIAQDLQEALEGKVYLDGIVKSDSEYLSVAYQSLIPILTKAIQELKAEIELLKSQING